MLSSRVVDIVEMRMDFPPSKTRSFDSAVWIWRAYQTHGKGGNWNIQTTPLWSNLDITESDYKFMVTHRPPEDNLGNPDEISSKGYFCARVQLQQAGNAIRIMHAGSQTLPEGTVEVCPTSGAIFNPQ